MDESVAECAAGGVVVGTVVARRYAGICLFARSQRLYLRFELPHFLMQRLLCFRQKYTLLLRALLLPILPSTDEIQGGRTLQFAVKVSECTGCP